MKSSLVSIIVPVFNVKDYVGRCLQSIAEQTYRDFEAILVDDGSTDGSGTVCDEFCRNDSRFRVIHQENAGLGFARNTGLDNARGAYILFVDSDDSLVPETVETAYQYLSSGAVDWVGFGIKRLDNQGTVFFSTENSLSHHAPVETLTSEDIIRRMLDDKILRQDLVNPFEPVWNKMYTREIIGDLRFEFAKILEDVLFNFHIYQRTEKAIFINKDLYQYFYRPGSITSRLNEKSLFLNWSHRMALERTTDPYSKNLFRVFALRKLYRVMATHRAQLIGTDYYASFMDICRPFRRRTVWEYVTSRPIPLFEKALSLTLWHFPRIGRFLFKAAGN